MLITHYRQCRAQNDDLGGTAAGEGGVMVLSNYHWPFSVTCHSFAKMKASVMVLVMGLGVVGCEHSRRPLQTTYTCFLAS